MALDDAIYKNKLLGLYTEMDQSPMSAELYAEKLAIINDTQIKTAEVNTGITVSIQSTSPPGTPSSGQTTTKGVIT